MLTEHGDETGAWSPPGRAGAPAEMAGTGVFLAGPAGTYITGALLLVDGGTTTCR
jgi:NAD(P)-dependent dehydrogenase (short-subunit alcohol dehydrogenase family)